MRGVIRVGWRVTGDDSFAYRVELPANVAATGHMPSLGDGAEEVVYRVGPGAHEFTGHHPRL